MNLDTDRMLRGWLLACMCATVACAQITFSRDWNGGKRSGPSFPIDSAQFNRVCRHFLHELKQTIAREMRSQKPRGTSARHQPDEEDNDNTINNYDE